MNEFEKAKLKEIADNYTEEEARIIMSAFPSAWLFAELQARDDHNRKIIERVSNVISCE